MAEHSGYKEKYLAALDDQEKLEKRFKAQNELLKKAVFQLSVAARGQESDLDNELVALQEKMRGAGGGQVYDQIERLQRTIATFDQSREKDLARIRSTLGDVIDNLLELQLDADIRRRLQQYRRSLNDQLASVREFSDALQQLGELQNMALAAASEPPRSLWQRLRGGRQLAQNRGEAPPEPSTAHDLQVEPVAGEERDQAQPVQIEDVDPVPNSLLDPSQEDSYPQVAKRISATLRSLMNSIEPNDVVRRKVEIVRARIERGMDWYALAVTLEDIRDILMARYLAVDKEFSDYLLRINQELVSISSALGVVAEQESSHQTAASEFSKAVSTQVNNIQQSMASSDSLAGLKTAVASHIRSIQDALSQYQHSQQGSEQSLAAQLKALVNRVHAIESESAKSREQLEEQRYKATHDPLTGLPNREAYNERAFHELHRFKRYNHPLTLAVCDLDHFKSINDRFGHQAGDKVLKLIAQVVSSRLREVDFVARYGGEEFVLIMPETRADQAFKVLDKIRAAVAKTPFRFKQEPVQITMSFGIVAFGNEDTVETAFNRADKALYQAKHDGRNRCILVDQDSESPD